MRNILLIVASGKSSRFGGFPKAFCKLGKITNLENTIEKSTGIIDKVYVGVNSVVYEKFHGRVKKCEMFTIKTGQGDAHSLLKCLKYIKEKESNAKQIMVCWGDAYFVSAKPFEELAISNQKISVACSLDEKPYAWFEVDGDAHIIKSHFAKDDGYIAEGMHDQSLFLFDIDFAIKYLDAYRKKLGIPEENDEEKSDINEMKLLHSFEFLNEYGGFAQCVTISKNQVLSFNTQEELETIIQKMAERRRLC